MAFKGWSDASEASTRAIESVVEQLGARELASIDPQSFCVFTETRPRVSTEEDGTRRITWPQNRFHVWHPTSDDDAGLVLLSGIEPHLQWKRYISLIREVMDVCHVDTVVTANALLDAVPHTRPTPVAVSATRDDLGPRFSGLRFPRSTYEGPAALSTVVGQELHETGVPTASLWGRAPHYLQVRPNPMVTLALLRQLQLFIGPQLHLETMEKEAERFAERISNVLKDQPDVQKYVSELEEKYDNDASRTQLSEMPHEDAERLVADVEAYLRNRQDDDDTGGGSHPR